MRANVNLNLTSRSPVSRPRPLLLELQLALLAVTSCRAVAASVLWPCVSQTTIAMPAITKLARLDPLPTPGAVVEAGRDRGG